MDTKQEQLGGQGLRTSLTDEVQETIYKAMTVGFKPTAIHMSYKTLKNLQSEVEPYMVKLEKAFNIQPRIIGYNIKIDNTLELNKFEVECAGSNTWSTILRFKSAVFQNI